MRVYANVHRCNVYICKTQKSFAILVTYAECSAHLPTGDIANCRLRIGVRR